MRWFHEFGYHGRMTETNGASSNVSNHKFKVDETNGTSTNVSNHKFKVDETKGTTTNVSNHKFKVDETNGASANISCHKVDETNVECKLTSNGFHEIQITSRRSPEDKAEADQEQEVPGYFAPEDEWYLLSEVHTIKDKLSNLQQHPSQVSARTVEDTKLCISNSNNDCLDPFPVLTGVSETINKTRGCAASGDKPHIDNAVPIPEAAIVQTNTVFIPTDSQTMFELIHHGVVSQGFEDPSSAEWHKLQTVLSKNDGDEVLSNGYFPRKKPNPSSIGLATSKFVSHEAEEEDDDSKKPNPSSIGLATSLVHMVSNCSKFVAEEFCTEVFTYLAFQRL